MVANAGRTGVGDIIYSAWITVSVEVTMNCNSLLRSIANCAFPWLSDEQQDILESYSSLVPDFFAGGFHSFVRWYRALPLWKTLLEIPVVCHAAECLENLCSWMERIEKGL